MKIIKQCKINKQDSNHFVFACCVLCLCVVLFVVFVYLGLPGGSRYNLNKVLIGSILLGTPMIVLALLLLLRKHR